MSDKPTLYDRIVTSSEPSDKKNALHGCEPIYILSAVDIQPVTQEILEKEFEVTKIRYPAWKNKTFQEFLQIKADTYETKYNIETYDTAYFLNPLTAEQYAKENMADINEAGSYPYLVIYSRPTNHMYAEANKTEVRLFVYERETDSYREIKNIKADEKYLYIIAKFDTFTTPPKETIN